MTTVVDLVETAWLTRYPCSAEIMNDQGSEFLGHEFMKSLTEKEYGILAKPISWGNSTFNAMLEKFTWLQVTLDERITFKTPL